MRRGAASPYSSSAGCRTLSADPAPSSQSSTATPSTAVATGTLPRRWSRAATRSRRSTCAAGVVRLLVEGAPEARAEARSPFERVSKANRELLEAGFAAARDTFAANPWFQSFRPVAG